MRIYIELHVVIWGFIGRHKALSRDMTIVGFHVAPIFVIYGYMETDIYVNEYACTGTCRDI